MAMEVTCGQCNGRLLVETLGVVVACPHCGVHLSIPHPDPIPAPAPPVPVPPPAVEPPSTTPPEPAPILSPPQEPPAPVPQISSVPSEPQELNPPPPQPSLAEMTSNDFAALATTGTFLAPNPPSTNASQDEQHSPNFLGEPEEHASASDQLGWASAPNLFLSPDHAAPIPDTSIGTSLQVFAPPTAMTGESSSSLHVVPPTSSEPADTPSTVEEAAVPVKPTWTFGAAPEPTQPVPSPAAVPSEAAMPAETFKFSAPQLLPSEPANAPSPPSQPGLQFFAAPAPEEKPETSAPAPATETRFVFMPAPVPAQGSAPPPTPVPATTTIPPAPVSASSPPAFVFSAAPPPAPAVEQTVTLPASFAGLSAPAPAPLVFGAAPSPALVPSPTAAPVSMPGFSPPGMDAANPPLPSSTVAEDVANYAENEFAQRQKLLMMLLLIVASYASAVSIVLVYMLVFGGASSLESLPDLVPPKKKPNSDKTGWSYFPPNADVAPWHTLQLGQSRRFGSVKVTPVKITRGPIVFEHTSGQAANNRSQSNDVLKLWVKFENVSRDQTFAPIDSHLLFVRQSQSFSQAPLANSFVAIESERKKGKLSSLQYEMSIESEFRMVGQNLGKELAPGDSLLTYIASEEDAASLSGDLVWRFQIRKGYNRKSFRGVTTLIDVRFKSSDITADVSM